MSGNPNMRPACEDGGCGIAARNETKSRTLFRMSFAGPTGGLQVTGPAGVIHRLGWPQSRYAPAAKPMSLRGS